MRVRSKVFAIDALPDAKNSYTRPMKPRQAYHESLRLRGWIGALLLLLLAVGCSSPGSGQLPEADSLHGSEGAPASSTESDDPDASDTAAADKKAETPAPEPTALDEVLPTYYDGLVGDNDAAKKAERHLKVIRQTEGDTPRLLAYLGSTRLLAARAASLPIRKLNYSKEGLALLDKAVKQDPDSVEIRFLRGISTVRLPSLFGRAKTAKGDLDFVRERADAARKSGELPERAYEIFKNMKE